MRQITTALAALALLAAVRGAGGLARRHLPEPHRQGDRALPGRRHDRHLRARTLATGSPRPSATTSSSRTAAGPCGNIGSDAVAKAEPDGYTLLVGAVGTHAINPSLYPRMPFDPRQGFRAGVLRRQRAERPGGQSRGVPATSVQMNSNSPRRRPGGAQLRLLRQRRLDPSLGRAVQGNDRHRHRPRPLQGQRGRR